MKQHFQHHPDSSRKSASGIITFPQGKVQTAPRRTVNANSVDRRSPYPLAGTAIAFTRNTSQLVGSHTEQTIGESEPRMPTCGETIGSATIAITISLTRGEQGWPSHSIEHQDKEACAQ